MSIQQPEWPKEQEYSQRNFYYIRLSVAKDPTLQLPSKIPILPFFLSELDVCIPIPIAKIDQTSDQRQVIFKRARNRL